MGRAVQRLEERVEAVMADLESAGPDGSQRSTDAALARVVIPSLNAGGNESITDGSVGLLTRLCFSHGDHLSDDVRAQLPNLRR